MFFCWYLWEFGAGLSEHLINEHYAVNPQLCISVDCCWLPKLFPSEPWKTYSVTSSQVSCKFPNILLYSHILVCSLPVYLLIIVNLLYRIINNFWVTDCYWKTQRIIMQMESQSVVPSSICQSAPEWCYQPHWQLLLVQVLLAVLVHGMMLAEEGMLSFALDSCHFHWHWWVKSIPCGKTAGHSRQLAWTGSELPIRSSGQHIRQQWPAITITNEACLNVAVT